MKSAPKLIAVAVTTALSFPLIASAQELTAVVTTDLNLRAGPAPNFPILATIPSNTNITIIGCNETRTWCDVQFDGNRGWSYAAYLSIQNVVVPQVTTPPPVVVFEPQTYWAANYTNQPFYADRDRFFGAGLGAGAGAVIGALVGPVGAAVGAAIGGAVGAAITPPDTVIAYVQQQPIPAQPIFLEGEVVLGATIPAAVTLSPIPDNPQFAYAYVNNAWVIADMQTRAIVHVQATLPM